MEPSEPRELTVDEAIALAIQLQKQHHLAEAEQLYAGVLDVVPHHPDALHYTGLLAHQQGRTDEAIDLIGQSLALSPNQADWHSNLGIVLQSNGRLADAIAEYERAIAIDPGHANAHSNLGVLLRATGRPEEAEAAYRTAIRLCPDHADAYTNLGILLNGLNRAKEASECFCRAITLRPKHPDARRLLALAHCMIGEVDEAVKILRNGWRRIPVIRSPNTCSPPAPAATCRYARRMRSWRRPSTPSPRASRPSSRACPTARRNSSQRRWPTLDSPPMAGWRSSTSAAEPGCAGHCFVRTRRDSPASTCLPGCSPMPGQKDVYTDLQQCELTEFLRARHEAFDVMVSADTLVYFGDLLEFCNAAAGALRPSGLLVFTLEHAVGEDDIDYRLELHGRYSHSLAYVKRVLTQSGLTAEAESAELRNEAGAPVAGLVVRATKPA